MEHSITVEIESQEELLGLFDETQEHVFIHQFNPNQVLEWWKSSIRTKNGVELENISVRNMKFDLQIPFSELKRILELNTRQLRIYQFEKCVPDTLDLNHLPEHSRTEILRSNGLKHFFWIDFEFVTVSSFDEGFIERIRSVHIEK